MFVKLELVDQMLCPQRMAHGDTCRGKECMAFRVVNTQDGEAGYCGMAGTPPTVTQGLMAEPLNAALALISGAAPAGKIVLPS